MLERLMFSYIMLDMYSFLHLSSTFDKTRKHARHWMLQPAIHNIYLLTCSYYSCSTLEQKQSTHNHLEFQQQHQYMNWANIQLRRVKGIDLHLDMIILVLGQAHHFEDLGHPGLCTSHTSLCADP